MENISIRISRSAFPLSKFYFNIDSRNFTVKSGEVVTIPLDKSGKYDLLVSLFWIKKKFRIDLSNNSIIKIKHVIPDIFYIISSVLLLLFAVLSFFSLINVLILPIALLIYVSPLIYFTFFNKSKYFKIEVCEE